MTNMFTNLAREATTLSPLMENREKTTVDDIIRDYPEGITITEFDIISTSLDTFPVFTFAEDDEKFCFGGTILHNIFDKFIEKFEGDIKAASNALKAAGGVKMGFSKSRTKNGNNITIPKIIG